MDTFCIKLSIVILLSFSLSATDGSSALKTIFLEDDCTEERNISFPIVYHVGSTNSSNSSGILAVSRNDSYNPYLDCWIILRPPPRDGIILTIHIKNPEANPSKENITISNSTDVSLPCGSINDQNESRSYDSEGDLNIHLHNGSDFCLKNRKEFVFIYTAYSKSPCETFEFECPSGCISKTLICDGYNHCGDNSDQKNCGKSKHKDTWKDAVKGISYAGSLGMCFGSVLYIIITFVVKCKELCVKYCCRSCQDSCLLTESNVTPLSRITIPMYDNDQHSMTVTDDHQHSRTNSSDSQSSSSASYDSQYSSTNSIEYESMDSSAPPSYEPPPSYETLNFEQNDISAS